MTQPRTLEERVRELEADREHHAKKIHWLSRQREKLLALVRKLHEEVGQDMPLDDDPDPDSVPMAKEPMTDRGR